MSVNPYFAFLAQFRANLEERGVRNVKATIVTQMAGKKWRQMSESQKEIYRKGRTQKEQAQTCRK